MLDTKGYKYPHSEYVILIAFPLQQSLHERASMLRFTYIVLYFRKGVTSGLSGTLHCPFIVDDEYETLVNDKGKLY
jgi:hypothetical protein